jgi:hypothetical protein
MRDDTRGALADLAVAGAASIALYVLARNPPLRRAVWRALKYGVFTAAPTLLWQETTRAWALSGTPDSTRSPEPRTNLESRIRNQE